jgi:hypothetical protein
MEPRGDEESVVVFHVHQKVLWCSMYTRKYIVEVTKITERADSKEFTLIKIVRTHQRNTNSTK